MDRIILEEIFIDITFHRYTNDGKDQALINIKILKALDPV